MLIVLPLFSLFLASVASTEYPEGRQAYNYYPYNFNNGVEPRFFRPTITSTTTTTSTSTITCTKSINPAPAACAGGRRRRSSLLGDDTDDEIHDKLPISPSAVQGVEATPEPSREVRTADPQLFVIPPYGYYHPEIQSGFYGGPLNYRPAAALPYSNHNSYGPPAGRLFFSLIPGFPGFIVTVMSTSTIFTITTSTSTPACATVGFLQCPI